MKSVALQQVSSDYAQRNAGRTLDKPVGLKHIRKKLPPELAASLEAACPDGVVYVWGAKAERTHQTVRMLGRGSWVLFRRGLYIYKHAIMIEKTSSPELAELLWGYDEDGETWSEVFFFAKVMDAKYPAAKFNREIGRKENYNWQGLVVHWLKESDKLEAFFQRHLSEI